MVSIRKRRHLDIQARYKILSQLSRLNTQPTSPDSKPVVVEKSTQMVNRASSETTSDAKPAIMPQTSPTCMDASSSKETYSALPALPVKGRKFSRRKQADNKDSCVLRGVYYKNMKWQAAIKVEKKQIHLGTVASMEEAAHLYDRAAYLCGRVPNFELSEEEKQELHGLHWEEFLLMTKEAIASKKKQKRVETCMRRRRTADDGDDMETQSIYHLEQVSYPQPISFDTMFHPTATDPHTPTVFYSTTAFPHQASFQEPSFTGDGPIYLHSIH